MTMNAVSDAQLIDRLRNGMLPVTYAYIADRLEALTAQKQPSLASYPGPLDRNPMFEEWRDTLPPTHWSKYDLSACRLGFDAGYAKALTQAPVVEVSDERYPSVFHQKDGTTRIKVAQYTDSPNIDFAIALENKPGGLWATCQLAPEEARQFALHILSKPSVAALSTQPTSAEADGSRCDDCRDHNPVWFAPSHLWNRVMGGETATDDPGGIVCVHCFIKRAEATGVKPTAWVVDIERDATADQAELQVERWHGTTGYVRHATALRLVAERDAAIQKLNNHWKLAEEQLADQMVTLNADKDTIARLREALERIDGHYTDTTLASKHMAAIARAALHPQGEK